jgi:hypothetical protein
MRRHGRILGFLAVGCLGTSCQLPETLRSSDRSRPSVETRSPEVTAATWLQIQRSIVTLELDQARRALASAESMGLGSLELRGTLALYAGDCEAASRIFGSSESRQGQEKEMSRLAEDCAGAMAGAAVTAEGSESVWVRWQNDADRPLYPLISEVVSRARTSIQNDLGIDLPKPLRIELVSDLFSLSKMTGLPLDAAETTGTVAVARLGRITMISPRAVPEGYPWQDTLCHEMTHLAISRASGDNAPLWLQEGLAKREERRWRPPRPKDDQPSFHAVAKAAAETGNYVPIDRIGDSIALLPTPEAARTTYAMVEDFVQYFIEQRGILAMRLLLHDLGQLPTNQSELAMTSTTGYGLSYWVDRWLLALAAPLANQASPPQGEELESAFLSPPPVLPSVVRALRTAELLADVSAWRALSETLIPALADEPTSSEVRWRLAHAQLELSQPEAALVSIGTPDQVRYVSGPWFAIQGRALWEKGQRPDSRLASEIAFGYAPTMPLVACRGWPKGTPPALLPDPPRDVLCAASK